jgi:hypothetical protein
MTGKLKRILLGITIPFALGAVSALLLLYRLKPEYSLFRSTSSVSSSASFAVLREIRDIYSLSTAEYTMKLIFPYDFTEPGINWLELKNHYDRDRNKFQAKSKPEYYPDNKLPLTWRYAKFYNLCREADIDMAYSTKFFVITTVVKAGYNLEPFMIEESEMNGLDISHLIRIETGEDDKKTLYIKRPEPVVTEFIIEDMDLKAKGYPDVAITPKQWSVLIRNLSPEIKNKALFKGLLMEADQNGRYLLERIFLSSGYDHVEFF